MYDTMSTVTDCFPLLTLMKPTDLGYHQVPTTFGSVTGSPVATTSDFVEKFLAAQNIDFMTYLSSVLPNGTRSAAAAGTNAIPVPTMPLLPSAPQQPGMLPLALHNTSDPSKPRRRNRTTFTSAQAKALEREYALDQYMPRSRRAIVADLLSLSESQVKTWFQNRRAKDKRTDKLNGIMAASCSTEHSHLDTRKASLPTTTTSPVNSYLQPASSLPAFDQATLTAMYLRALEQLKLSGAA